MKTKTQLLADAEHAPIVGPGRREWIGLAALVLRQCGMSMEEIKTVISAGADEIVLRMWNCVGSRMGGPWREGER